MWEDLIAWGVRELKGNELRVIACKLSWWATVYHIWLQRNAIVHEERIWTEEQLKRSIIKDFKARLGFKTKFKKSVLNATIYCNWGIDPCSILIWSLKSCAVVFCQSANLCATMLKVLVVIIVLETRTDQPNRPVQSRTESQSDPVKNQAKTEVEPEIKKKTVWCPVRFLKPWLWCLIDVFV